MAKLPDCNGFPPAGGCGCADNTWASLALDHCKYAPIFEQNAIDCYAGADAALSISKATGANITAFKRNKWNTVGEWMVLPFDVPHENEPNYGFVIQAPSGHRMMYLTDFQYTRYTFRRMHLEMLLIACNHMDDIEEYAGGSENFKHVVRGHSTLSVVKNCIRANQTKDLKNVVLCHLSEDNAEPAEMWRQVQDTVGDKVTVNIAQKGLVVELG